MTVPVTTFLSCNMPLKPLFPPALLARSRPLPRFLNRGFTVAV
jgi:hypothetical protein